LARAHALIDREVERIGRIQRALLPNPLPRIPGLEIAASYETFGEAGGDLYDLVPLAGPGAPENERWGVFIADASGHGPAAAVVIAMTQALLHAPPPGVTGPAALLRHLNEHLCCRPIEGSFVTAFGAVYDPASRQLTFARAGHPPPLLVRPLAQQVERLDAFGGYPLGIDAGQTFQEATLQLRAGDALLLYTDGIQEAQNPSGVEFGIDGIEAAVRCSRGTPQQLVAVVRHAVLAHAHGRPATDDQTLVAISVV
jgi:sigma-B regulation protein RsbU (phosphoserine phosphatase)